MSNLLNKITKISLYSLVFLTPLFWLPFSFEIFEFNKQYLLFFLGSVAFFSWILKMILVDGEIRFKKTPLDIFVLGFLFWAILSSFFSVDKLSSLFGFYGRFSDGLLGLISLVMVYFLITNNTASRRGLLKTFFWSYSLLLLFAFVSMFDVISKASQLLGLKADLPQFMLQRIFNPAGGSLEGLSVVVSLIAVFLTGFILIKNKEDSEKGMFPYWLLLFSSLLFLILVDFKSAWVILAGDLILLLGFALWKRFFKKNVNRLLLPVLLVICSLFFIFAGSAKISFLNFLPLAKERVLNQETSWSAAFGAAKSDLKSGFLGTGPGTWHYDFNKWKPDSFNQNDLWQFRFDRPGSHLAEILGTAGFLGLVIFLALIGFFLLISYFLLAANSGKSFPESKSNLPFLMIMAALFISQIVYYQNSVLAFIFWFFLAIAVVNWQNSSQEKVFSLKKFPELSLIFSTFLIIVGLGLAAVFYFGVRFYLADNIFLQVQKTDSLDSKIVLLERATQLNPYQPQYWAILARAYLQKTREEANIDYVGKSKEAAERAISVGPAQVAALETLAMVYRDLKDFPGGRDWAIKSFERAINLEPANPVLRTELAKLLVVGDLSRAKEELAIAKALKPEYLDALLLESVIFEQEGDIKEATKAMEKAVSSYPFNADARFNLGRLYFNNKNIDDAISQFEAVLILSPNHSNALYSLGTAHERKGMTAKAKDYFERVLELNPDNPDIKQAIDNLLKKD